MKLQDASSLSLIGPSYNIYRFTDQIYKIVHFPNPRNKIETEKAEKVSTGEKLDSTFSRARRVILELALCNPWKYFCTFTLDSKKYDRYSLDKWYKSFTQWIRDQRKKFNCDISYLLIPEMHKDGAWHMHGMFSDVPGLVSFSQLLSDGMNVPVTLAEKGYLCWIPYFKKYGYCSFGQIKSPVAAGFYITKYMEKSFDDSQMPVGAHLYYASHGLNRAEKHGEIYGESDYLNTFTPYKYQYCETGMTHLDDGLSWDFALEYMAITPLSNDDESLQSLESEYMEVMQFEQTEINM